MSDGEDQGTARRVIDAIGPKSIGRRKYDQSKIWYAWVRDLGFAGFAYYLLHVGIGYVERHDRTLSEQAAAMRLVITENSRAVGELARAVSLAQVSCSETRGAVLGVGASHVRGRP
jgi:hypothetical protein